MEGRTEFKSVVRVLIIDHIVGASAGQKFAFDGRRGTAAEGVFLTCGAIVVFHSLAARSVLTEVSDSCLIALAKRLDDCAVALLN